MEPRVVIVGAGFGGLAVARGLRKSKARLTVIDRANHHLFQPLLYQVATAGLSPADIASPIRDVLRGQAHTEVLMTEVTGVDTSRRCVITPEAEIPYDYLVLAPGSRYHYFGHEEWARFAPSLKTLRDALRIREEMLRAFEQAEIETDAAARSALMTFVLVGGGPTGVEMAGSLAELARMALRRDFRRIRPETARILLLEAGPRILSAFPERLSEAAHRALERLGAEVRTNARVESIDAGGVSVGGERIPSLNVFWTAGVMANPAGEWIGAKTDRSGRVLVAGDLTAPGQPDVFVIGDAAFLEQDGVPLPGVAPVAQQQGKYAAAVIRARIDRRTAPGPFRYFDKGNMATVGRSFAILHRGRLQLYGFLTWALWVVIHIWNLIGFRARLVVMFQWLWAYATYRRSARLITSESPARVSEAAPASQSAPAEGSGAARVE